jgi:hypothetical protein
LNKEIFGVMLGGVVVGWLLMYLIRRVKEFSSKDVKTIILTLFGATFIKGLLVDKSLWWLYPVGLLSGIIIYISIALYHGTPPDQVLFGYKNNDDKK